MATLTIRLPDEKDIEVLTAIREGIRTKNTLEEIRQIYQTDET
ncbi:MAG: hypothetical protein VKN72_19880 [Nostocales cyanobacterium 94392]|nr:hypothetical protein [Nostocales cyanobacterium 94392]